MIVVRKIIGYTLFGIGFLFVYILKFLIWISVCVIIGVAFIMNLEHGIWLALLGAIIGGIIVGLVAGLVQFLANLLGLIFIAGGAKLIEG